MKNSLDEESLVISLNSWLLLGIDINPTRPCILWYYFPVNTIAKKRKNKMVTKIKPDGKEGTLIEKNMTNVVLVWKRYKWWRPIEKRNTGPNNNCGGLRNSPTHPSNWHSVCLSRVDIPGPDRHVRLITSDNIDARILLH